MTLPVVIALPPPSTVNPGARNFVKPVQFVRLPDVGVPRIGVTRVGLVAKTFAPVPVSSVNAAARFAEEGVAKKVATLVPKPVIEPTAGVIVVLAAAVMRPFPLTVKVPAAVADPNAPTLLLTVARVPAAVTFPVPSKAGEVHTKSPVIAIVRPVASAVAVAAFPVVDPEVPLTLPVTLPVKGPANPAAVKVVPLNVRLAEPSMTVAPVQIAT